MEPITVNFSIRLDKAAIQDRADLATWAQGLRLSIPEIATWDMVYEELAKVMTGAQHYSAFSQTALADMDTFHRYVLSSEVSIAEVKTTSSKVPVGEKPVVKVVAPPPPPPPIKTKTTA